MDFLDPVVEAVNPNSRILDIGTGAGKLMQRLITERSALCTGIDTNQSMLDEAEIKLKDLEKVLLKIEPNTALPFSNATFDCVSFCNVLFNLSKESVLFLLSESLRVLGENGKIIVLTPTGNGGFIKLSRLYFSIKNLSIYIWYYATKNKASPWQKNNLLSEFCRLNNLNYECRVVLNGFGLLEIISNK